MINLYKTLFLFEWFLGKIMIFLFKKVSVLNWEIFSLLSAKFLGIAGARRKGRWAIWNFLPFVIFTWAFFLVCCLPKECFSQERPEEQRGRTCSVGEKALMWSVSGDHRQGSSMIEKKKKRKKAASGDHRFSSKLWHWPIQSLRNLLNLWTSQCFFSQCKHAKLLHSVIPIRQHLWEHRKQGKPMEIKIVLFGRAQKWSS